MKCKECGNPTKQETSVCFNCEMIVKTMHLFEQTVGRYPITGKPRKLEILKYKITRL